MRFYDKTNILYVIDSYKGLYKINFNNNKAELLFDNINGQKITLMNDLDINYKQNIIYFTISSQRWGRNKIILELLSLQKQGLLCSYNIITKQVNILNQNLKLSLANGVVLSYDNNYVLFVSGPNIWSYNILTKDFKIAVKNLPAIGDNIRKLHYPKNHKNYNKNRYLLGCASKRSKPFSLMDILGQYPLIRDIIGLLLPINTILNLIPRMGLIIELEINDPNDYTKNKIVRTFQDLSKNGVAYISEAEVFGDYLYWGSWHENYISRIKTSEFLY